VIEVLLSQAVNLDAIQVKRDHEDHRVEKAGVNVTPDILIVEGNVDPSTCTG